MGGLRKFMPVTFVTYAIGMLSLSGFPLLFSGFWSKEDILHSAHTWSVSHWPFYLGLIGALLTAFYMTRQVFYVFFGNCRLALGKTTASEQRTVEHAGLPAKEHPHVELATEPHESPLVMTAPLMVLAVFAIVLGFIGTPAWPWFQDFLNGSQASVEMNRLFESEVVRLILLSSVIVFIGLGLGWWFYGRQPIASADAIDPLERMRPDIFALLKRKYFVDEAYQWSMVRFNAWFARACSWLDTWIWNGVVQLISLSIVGLSWVNRIFDEKVVNLGFDESCRRLTQGGGLMARFQDGRVQNYLRVIGVALTVLLLVLIWGCRAS